MINKVWIAEGCIVCNACEAECPDVFHVTDTTCFIRAEARQDSTDSENSAEMSELTDEAKALEDSIIAAAVACPVEVIKYE
jgi:ferredoxin